MDNSSIYEKWRLFTHVFGVTVSNEFEYLIIGDGVWNS